MKQLIVTCMLLLLSTTASAQDTMTLSNTVAYIGSDRNVYISDGETTVAVTDDSFFDQTDGQVVNNALPQWSSDGTQLAFMRRELFGPALSVMRSGMSPTVLVNSDGALSLDSPVFAWSPDGTQIAVFGNDGEQWGLFAISVADGSQQYLSAAEGGCVGEAGGEPPEFFLLPQESGNVALREQYDIVWAGEHIVFGPPRFCSGIALTTRAGEWLWNIDGVSEVVISANGSRIAIFDFSLQSWLSVDAADGTTHMLDLPDEAQVVGWWGDALLYRTFNVTDSATGDMTAQAGFEAYIDFWGFTSEQRQLTLWRHQPDGEDTHIFSTAGYDVGLVRVVDDRLVMSIVTSSIEAVNALNAGGTVSSIDGLRAHPVIYVLDGDELLFTIDGGQPDYNPQPFTIPPPR